MIKYLIEQIMDCKYFFKQWLSFVLIIKIIEIDLNSMKVGGLEYLKQPNHKNKFETIISLAL